MPNLGDPTSAVNQINTHAETSDQQRLRQRCEAIALLWQAGEYGDDVRSLQRAVDAAYAASLTFPDIPTDKAQWIMGRAFAAVRDDLGGWRP